MINFCSTRERELRLEWALLKKCRALKAERDWWSSFSFSPGGLRSCQASIFILLFILCSNNRSDRFLKFKPIEKQNTFTFVLWLLSGSGKRKLRGKSSTRWVIDGNANLFPNFQGLCTIFQKFLIRRLRDIERLFEQFGVLNFSRYLFFFLGAVKIDIKSKWGY